jgi:hypothetical protein
MIPSCSRLIANHPYTSQFIGGALGAASAIGAKKLAPFAFRYTSSVSQKVSDIWMQKKIKELNTLVCDKTLTLEKRTTAAQTIIHVSKNPSLSKKARSKITSALDNIIGEVDMERSLQDEAFERLLEVEVKENSVCTIISRRIWEERSPLSREKAIDKIFEILQKPWLSATETYHLRSVLHVISINDNLLDNRIVEKNIAFLQTPGLAKEKVNDLCFELVRIVEYDDDLSIRTKALDGVLELLQQSWLSEESFSSVLFSVTSLLNSYRSIDPSLKTRIVDGIISSLHNNQLSYNKSAIVFGRLTFGSPCESLDLSLRTWRQSLTH